MSFEFKGGKSNFTLLDNFIKLSKEKESIVAIGLLKDFNSNYENGNNVVSVAIQNEFGTEKIPSRPFMRTTAIKYEKDLNRLRNGLIKKIISGKITLQKALEIIGQEYVYQIKYVINHENFAPNAASTIARKGSNKRPLIDTTRMIESINYKVRNK